MTEPVSYRVKDPNTVQAMYAGDSGEFREDIASWVTPLLPEDAVINLDPWNLTITNGGFQLNVNAGFYVYVDEDGLHTVDKGAFEMVYTEDVV